MPKPKSGFFVYCIQKERKKFTEKELFKEKGEWRIEQKQKEGFLTTLATAIKKDPTMSIRKNVDELKVHKKLNQTIKQDLSPDLKPLNYAIWVILENKTNATSHLNIGSLKTAIEEEWNKMSEEFILNACKSFRRHVDTIIEKNSGHID